MNNYYIDNNYEWNHRMHMLTHILLRTFNCHTDPSNPDTDLDEQNDYNDPVPLDYDMDVDGMSDVYEVKYGCSEESFTCDLDSGIVYNEVYGNGWQHPWIHNSRYALLIGMLPCSLRLSLIWKT
ncbi:MAG: hypothetical protein QMC80_03760 [Thermoplasmatales archaeon]|nr:hypothetical protein [Thermoplasmatales archaeon]